MTNARSLCNKFDELCVYVSKLRVSIVVVTETWFTSEMENFLFHIPGYVFFRDDRTNRKGGGVGVWIQDGVFCKLLDFSTSKPAAINCVWLLLNENIVFCSCYIPPALSAADNKRILEYLSDSLDNIKANFPNVKAIICGDFNNLDYTSLLINHNLFNKVTIPTRGNAILDIILLDETLFDDYSVCTTYPPLKNSDHQVVHLIGNQISKPSARVVEIYDYRDEYMSKFYNYVSQINWSGLYFAPDDINLKCDKFYELLMPGLNFIPKHVVTLTSTDKAWMTPVVKRIIQLRWDAYRKRDFVLYNHYKEKAKSEISKAKNSWSKRLLVRGKGVWNLVNSHRKTTQSIDCSTSPSELNSQFANVFQSPVKDPSTILMNTESATGWCPHFTPEEVEKALVNIPLKAAGSDGLPAKLLRVAANHLSKPLCHLYNMSILLQAVPERWKIAKIIPVPKDNKPQTKNFRPISLLPLVSKILERCILNRMSQTLISKYGKNQFGFRKASNTTCALITLCDNITREWESPNTRGVSVISFDATKAFDTVPHDLLLQRLLDHDLPLGFVAWFQDYLRNRQQFVSVNGKNSNKLPVLSGVPQGAILSPSIFCLYVAPLTVVHMKNSLYKFADDMALSLIHTTAQTDEITSASEIDNIFNWCTTNRIALNKNKTSRILMSKNDSKFDYNCLKNIHESDTLKLLGITIAKNLSWSPFIQEMVRKANRQLHLLRVLKPFLGKDMLIKLHIALIQAHLDYGSPLYVGSLKQSDRILIKKLIARAHRIICGFGCENNCLPDPEERRLTLSLKLFEAGLLNTEHILHDLFPSYLPSGRRLMVPPHSTHLRGTSFLIFMTIYYNSLI